MGERGKRAKTSAGAVHSLSHPKWTTGGEAAIRRERRLSDGECLTPPPAFSTSPCLQAQPLWERRSGAPAAPMEGGAWVWRPGAAGGVQWSRGDAARNERRPLTRKPIRVELTILQIQDMSNTLGRRFLSIIKCCNLFTLVDIVSSAFLTPSHGSLVTLPLDQYSQFPWLGTLSGDRKPADRSTTTHAHWSVVSIEC